MMLEGISPSDITELEIPTGIPYLYELDDQLVVTSGRYLGDPAAAAAAAAAVGKQAG
jgi:2,3-bisphosphoglycerate-dependent phosphoglycerate mutase